jgi:hypothetical protein
MLAFEIAFAAPERLMSFFFATLAPLLYVGKAGAAQDAPKVRNGFGSRGVAPQATVFLQDFVVLGYVRAAVPISANERERLGREKTDHLLQSILHPPGLLALS